MSLKARFIKYRLNFNFPIQTSKLTLKYKISYFLEILNSQNNTTGIGEISVIDGLTPDTDIEKKLEYLCDNIQNHQEILKSPSYSNNNAIKFGFDTAIYDLKSNGSKILFPSQFTNNLDYININGLIWIGNQSSIMKQIDEKIDIFDCIKLKVGFNLDNELKTIKFIRKKYKDKIIRLDANGAYNLEEAKFALEQFAKYNIHSIEQPLPIGNWQDYATLINNSPIDIGIDEELTTVNLNDLKELLNIFKPKYFIIKPSMLGDFSQINNIINLAEEHNIGWWFTSALESNIGLNAIAQFSYIMTTKYNNKLVQGLGTGSIYKNNIKSPLKLDGMRLFYKHNDRKWQNNTLNFLKRS